MSSLWDRRRRGKRIYACDSFRGLQAAYENLPAGNFATPVPRLALVRIVEGFFEESLTPELARQVGKTSLAHFDPDLHSSTACALAWLTPLLQPGSLLLFDEFLGEDPAEERVPGVGAANRDQDGDARDVRPRADLACLPVADLPATLPIRTRRFAFRLAAAGKPGAIYVLHR
jgi:hypothetical protein